MPARAMTSIVNFVVQRVHGHFWVWAKFQRLTRALDPEDTRGHGDLDVRLQGEGVERDQGSAGKARSEVQPRPLPEPPQRAPRLSYAKSLSLV